METGILFNFGQIMYIEWMQKKYTQGNMSDDTFIFKASLILYNSSHFHVENLKSYLRVVGDAATRHLGPISGIEGIAGVNEAMFNAKKVTLSVRRAG